MAVTVHLDADDASSTVVLHVGDRLRIELPTAPQTGFQWQAKLIDASHLQRMSKDVRPESGRLDAAGTQVFVWKAISPGQASASLTYSRPADGKTAPPVKRISIQVDVVVGELTPKPSVSATAADWQLTAIYKGTLPCDDCTGIAVEVAIYSQQSDAASLAAPLFVERRRYLGAPGGNRTIVGTGRLTKQDGTYADAAIRTYTLSAPDGSTENFRVDGDRLVPLDAQMLPIPPPPNRDIALHKESDASRP